ncbi:mycofactocin-coupled SDR family oxidoreductase [Lysinibacillus pakistanensis]|uniref:Mycofactocin-coupled SDR family oxidoreductase n=2 Tax=Lysinibacillus pakistanensis TaxID=759811 RepID=A0ABX6D9D7_9BACI|nr:mycofactocin-coupled SDR family oxidoreductase [Lysinibacillus pakistanensis]QGG51251.1 mycofactocin-coupled SDR family oxidoreductase [Lysinibacillus pakistanensis]WHY48615.1 mycofactocin-coupled SDR family oxidoreductase [Lysinibacillus pakistanensis]
MMGKLAGKTAFITGGARGMGREYALRFAEEGAAIVITDIAKDVPTVAYEMAKQSELAQTVDEIKKHGVDALGLVADVRNAQELELAVQKTIEHFGKIDILVTNAGILSYNKLWEMSEQQWDEMLDICLKGTWLTCKYVLPHMIDRQAGKILCVSSVNGLRGGQNVGHYVAAKHGVLGLVKTLAMEVGPYNIHVNAICPTAVDTTMANNQATYDRLANKKGATREEATPAFGNHHVFPHQDFIAPKDVINAALFLVSDDSNNISGSHIAVDAGYLTM